MRIHNLMLGFLMISLIGWMGIALAEEAMVEKDTLPQGYQEFAESKVPVSGELPSTEIAVAPMAEEEEMAVKGQAEESKIAQPQSESMEQPQAEPAKPPTGAL